MLQTPFSQGLSGTGETDADSGSELFNITEDFTAGGLSDSVSTTVTLTITDPPVPEPSSLVLLASGAFGILAAFRRRLRLG